jgi:aminoglycoside 6'-N-acetyltransferase
MVPMTFRRLTRDDFEMLAGWLAQPHVQRWWHHQFSAAAVERDFGPTVDGEEPAEDHVVALGGDPIGLIQYCRLHDYGDNVEELRPLIDVPAGAVSIDYLIGDPSLIGRGVGRAMITAFVERIWRTEAAATCVIVPVCSANVASWTALLRAGFTLVARGELEPDNPIDDPLHEILRLDRPGTVTPPTYDGSR